MAFHAYISYIILSLWEPTIANDVLSDFDYASKTLTNMPYLERLGTYYKSSKYTVKANRDYLLEHNYYEFLNIIILLSQRCEA